MSNEFIENMQAQYSLRLSKTEKEVIEKHAKFLDIPASHLFRYGALVYAKQLRVEKEKLLNEKF